MEAEIKRIAQLLFDNAKYLAFELNKSDACRTLQIDLWAFSNGTEQVNLLISDSRASLKQLKDNRIIIERIRELFKVLNEDCGIEPLPEPIETREKL